MLASVLPFIVAVSFAQAPAQIGLRAPARPAEAAALDPVPVRVVLEGVVHGTRGAPARGALVVSSAGGQAIADASGAFRLAVSLPADAASIEVTAVGRGDEGLANRRVAFGGAPGRIGVGALQLSAGGGCSATWLPTFGGLPGTDWFVNALAVYDDGSGPALYVGGGFSAAGGTAANLIAKWDGAGWSALGSGIDDGFFTPFVYALAVHDDGAGEALYVGGHFTSAGGVPVDNLARWDGTSWSAVGTGLGGNSDSVHALTVHDDGGGAALYAGGNFGAAGTLTVNHIAKWDGTSWSALGAGVSPGGFGAVSALTSFDDGSGAALYAGGLFTSAGGAPANRIARWNGTGWSTLGSGMNSTVRTLAVHDPGGGARLYAGGLFTDAGGSGAGYLAQWDGSAWSGLGVGLDDRVDALAVYDDGSGPALFAAGDFSGGGLANGIAKWNGSTWAPVGGGMDDYLTSLAVYDDGSGPALFAGGGFATAGGGAASHVARWDASSWDSLGEPGLNGGVGALAAFDDGGAQALYVGGSFTTAGGAPANRVAQWDGAAWTALGGGLDDFVSALAMYDDGSGPALFAGGDFSSAGGAFANRIARWNGTSWSGIGSIAFTAGQIGAFPTVDALAVYDDGSGEALYVGGWFELAGGQFADNIARWDGTSWSAVGGGVSSLEEVLALAVYDDGSGPALYAGGWFGSAGGVPVNHVARWDGTSWSALAGGTNGAVFALATFDDGSGEALYAGGIFTTAGGAPANRVAKWDGTGWTPLGGGLSGGFSPNVSALAAVDGRLYAGGRFTSAAGLAVNNLARWDGSSWAGVGGGFESDVLALAAFDDGGGSELHVGGAFAFSEAGDAYLARLGTDGGCGSVIPYCTAGTSASGCQASLSATGTPSATAASGFDLLAADVEGAKDGLFFFGSSGRQANPWGNGTSYQCVVPPVSRGGLLVGVGASGQCDGSFAQDLNALWATKPAKNPGAGAVVQAQLWYRDPANTSNQTTSLSDAVEFTVSP